MASVFRTHRRVEFCETDAAGIAHFSSFLLYMEQAEHAFLRSLGTSVMVYHDPESGTDSKTSWPRVHVECDYSASAKFEELLEVELRVSKIGEKSVTYEFRFALHEKTIATGKVTAVHCSAIHGKMRGTPIPEPLRSQMMAFLSTNESSA